MDKWIACEERIRRRDLGVATSRARNERDSWGWWHTGIFRIGEKKGSMLIARKYHLVISNCLLRAREIISYSSDIPRGFNSHCRVCIGSDLWSCLQILNIFFSSNYTQQNTDSFSVCAIHTGIKRTRVTWVSKNVSLLSLQLSLNSLAQGKVLRK